MKFPSIVACLTTLGALPAQSPSPVSTLAPTEQHHVVFDRPRADGPLWACGSAWKASFDGTGCTVIPFFGSNAPRNFPLHLEVAAPVVGGEVLAMSDGKPFVKDGAVRTARGSFTEVIDTRMDSLEQSFVFDALPNRGAIEVEVRIHTELAPSVIENGVRFANEHGHVDYTKAIAVDAAGRRLALPIEWTGRGARMVIPASFVEQAQLPLVLDPLLTYWWGLGNPAILQHDGDVATIQAAGLGGRTLLVWQRQWSATDQDCWGLMFDNNLGLVQTDFSIDFTPEDWLKVAVAGNNYAQNFLVVSESRIGLLWFVAGRTVAVNAAVGSQFDIEREGVVGTPGNNFHPDVGSDPYFGVGRYTVVFNKKALGVSDIYMKQVMPAGTLVTTNAVAISTAAEEETRPAISKSCGQSNGPAAQWLLTWQRTWPNPPHDQEIWGRFVSWNGALGASPFAIAFNTDDETAPSPGSPIDVGGQRLWPVCHETAPVAGQPRDVVVKIVNDAGTWTQSAVVSGNVPGADDREPEMDSDGTRFVVAMTTGSSGFPQQIEVVTCALLPSNMVQVQERTGMATSSAQNYGQCNVVAQYSGGSTPTSVYKICFTEQTPNTLRLASHGGWASGSFFTNRSTQCGNLAINASGSTALGETLTIDVANGGLSAVVAGFPVSVWLDGALGCHCLLGVDIIGFWPNPFVWTIPQDPTLVNTTFSAQGFTLIGTQCLGNSIDLSDTIDFTIR